MVWLIIILILLVLFTILIFLPIKTKLQYYYHSEAHQFIINVYMMRIRIFHKKLNLQEQVQSEYSVLIDMIQNISEGKHDSSIKQIINDVVEQLKNAKKLLFFLLKKITIQELNWKTYFGTGEASSTGIASGGFWMVKGTLVGLIYELSTMKCEPKLSVFPYFQAKGFRTEIDCIVTIRLGKAIHTALQVIRNFNLKEEVYS